MAKEDVSPIYNSTTKAIQQQSWMSKIRIPEVPRLHVEI